MGNQQPQQISLLGYIITPAIVRQAIQKAAQVRWGTHLVRWRYLDVQHEGVTYRHKMMLPTGLWHLLKRVYVDQDWPLGTTQEALDRAAREVVMQSQTQIYLYGYYRTEPPRLQWGFLNEQNGIAVVYDMEADLVVTVFKPIEGALFFERQIAAVQIDREAWQV